MNEIGQIKTKANNKVNTIKSLNDDLMKKLDQLMKNPLEPVAVANNKEYYNNEYNELNKEFEEKPKTQLSKKRKAFITDVELEKELSNLNKMKEDDQFDFLRDEDLSQYSREQIEEAREFENMIKEVDSYKNKMKKEHDYLQYLITKVKETKTKVNRHMYGVRNLVEQSGYKNKNTSEMKNEIDVVSENEEDEDDKGIYDENGEYDKDLNLDIVADKLINIQQGVINFHQDLNKKMVRVEQNNSQMRKLIDNGKNEVLNTMERETNSRGKSRGASRGKIEKGQTISNSNIINKKQSNPINISTISNTMLPTIASTTKSTRSDFKRGKSTTKY
jgi:hypothetical protein